MFHKFAGLRFPHLVHFLNSYHVFGLVYGHSMLLPPQDVTIFLIWCLLMVLLTLVSASLTSAPAATTKWSFAMQVFLSALIHLQIISYLSINSTGKPHLHPSGLWTGMTSSYLIILKRLPIFCIPSLRIVFSFLLQLARTLIVIMVMLQTMHKINIWKLNAYMKSTTTFL